MEFYLLVWIPDNMYDGNRDILNVGVMPLNYQGGSVLKWSFLANVTFSVLNICVVYYALTSTYYTDSM